MRAITFLSSMLLLTSLAAGAAGTSDITIEQPWALASAPTVSNGAAYMTIVNKGTRNDLLLGVAGEVADKIELHDNVTEAGVMKMRQVDIIGIRPGDTILAPGGLHIMLIGLKKPLVDGQKFNLLLNFEKAGKIPVEFTVSQSAPKHTP